MAFDIYKRVSLKTNVPEYGLLIGDVATIVDHHPGTDDKEEVYSLEVYNAIGGTIAVIQLDESKFEPLSEGEILHVRKIDIIV